MELNVERGDPLRPGYLSIRRFGMIMVLSKFSCGTDIPVYGAKGTGSTDIPVCVASRTDNNVCASAPVKVVNLRGGSPRREEIWTFVAEGNCIAARRGGSNRKRTIRP